MRPRPFRAGLRSLEPIAAAQRTRRARLGLRDEFLLALLPTATVLLVLLMVDTVASQRLLFASLASSAFLIYLDPHHGTNSVRTLIVSQTSAASVGWATYSLMGSGYLSSGIAMVLIIAIMIAFDVVHPPAIGTAMSFALRAGDASNLLLFGAAVAMTGVLVVLERAVVWLLARHDDGPGRPGGGEVSPPSPRPSRRA
jgi:CBS-domain-containing membrane protein